MGLRSLEDHVWHGTILDDDLGVARMHALAGTEVERYARPPPVVDLGAVAVVQTDTDAVSKRCAAEVSGGTGHIGASLSTHVTFSVSPCQWNQREPPVEQRKDCTDGNRKAH